MIAWHPLCACRHPDMVAYQCAESAVVIMLSSARDARVVSSKSEEAVAPSRPLATSPEQRGLKLPLSANKAACL